MISSFIKNYNNIKLFFYNSENEVDFNFKYLFYINSTYLLKVQL